MNQLTLEFLTLVGPSDSSDAIVRLDSIGTSSNVVRLTHCTDSAYVTIKSDCIVGVRFGKFLNKLEGSIPNPSGSIVEVTYQQLEDARAVLRIYDINGREVLRPLDAILPGGRYTVRFDVSDLPSGRYIYEISVGTYREAKGMGVER